MKAASHGQEQRRKEPDGILYSQAVDPDGEVVQARTARQDKQHSCIECAKPMVLRRSGNTGRGARRPHFAHKSKTSNCSPETVLHRLFKQELANYIADCIVHGQAIPFLWECQHCNDTHEGNLAKRAARVAVEHDMDVARPDIALLDAEGAVISVVEIIVTHPISAETREFYSQRKLHVIEYRLKTESVLDDVPAAAASPTAVSACRNPKCVACGAHKHSETLRIIDAACYDSSCGKPMKVAVIHAAEGSSSHLSPDSFNEHQLAIARARGVKIRRSFSRTLGTAYLANACPHCKAFVGEHYLFTEYISPALYGDLPSTTEVVGYTCVACLRREEEPDGDFDD